jgi:Flp pilus assembly protein TadG
MMSGRRRRTRGGNVVEFALLLPWMLFLFVGAYDWGFYAHALISTENATRVAALYGSIAPSGTVYWGNACALVRGELSISPNVVNLSTCVNGTSVSSSTPVGVSVSCTTLDSIAAVQVTVAYQTLQLIPIPGLLEGQATLYRTTEMPMNNTTNTCTYNSGTSTTY